MFWIVIGGGVKGGQIAGPVGAARIITKADVFLGSLSSCGLRSQQERKQEIFHKDPSWHRYQEQIQKFVSPPFLNSKYKLLACHVTHTRGRSTMQTQRLQARKCTQPAVPSKSTKLGRKALDRAG